MAFLLFVLAQNLLEAEGPWFSTFVWVSFPVAVICYCTSRFMSKRVHDNNVDHYRTIRMNLLPASCYRTIRSDTSLVPNRK